MRTRLVLSIASLLVIPFIIAYVVYTSQPSTVVKDLEANDLLKSAIQIKVEQSRSEFQLALLMLGALWGLLIAKKDEANILLSDWPELLMFGVASLLLLSSCAAHFFYVDNIAYVYSLAGSVQNGKTMPDVFTSGINNPYDAQFVFLLTGFVIGGLALWSAHRLKAS